MSGTELPSDEEVRAVHRRWRRNGGTLALLALLGGGAYLYRRFHRSPPQGPPLAEAPTLSAYLPGREEADGAGDYLEAVETLERQGERGAVAEGCAPDEARHAEALAGLERGAARSRASPLPAGGARVLACLGRLLDARAQRALRESRFPSAEHAARQRLSLAEHLLSQPDPEARALGRAAAGEALLRLSGALAGQGRLPLEERLRIAKLAAELRLLSPSPQPPPKP